MLVWLHTADHIRGASPVQEAEGAAAVGDRTGILRFPVGEQEAPIALRFVHHRRGLLLRCRMCFILTYLLSGGATDLCGPVPTPLPRLPLERTDVSHSPPLVAQNE